MVGTFKAEMLDNEIDAGANTMWLTLGVGIDPSTARSILRSIHPAGTEPTSSSTKAALLASFAEPGKVEITTDSMPTAAASG